MARILIIEDEEKMARMLARVLREEGYVAETAGDGRTGLGRASDDSFDLLIVDWMLPERSGVQVVRGLRAAEVATPVLMLTARDQVEDKVEGLDAGADDTSGSPSPSPLLARVRALTRRPRGETGDGGMEIWAGDITLDPVRHVVRRGDERIDRQGVRAPGDSDAAPRAGLLALGALDTVWRVPGEVNTSVVEHVSYLRRKLVPPRSPSRGTVRGVGYTFEPRP